MVSTIFLGIRPSWSHRAGLRAAVGRRADSNRRLSRCSVGPYDAVVRAVVASVALLSLLSVAAASSGTSAPRGGLIAFSRCRPDGCGQGTDLWVIRPDRSGLRRLTRSRTHNDAPSWSPDGRRLVFVGGATDSSQLWLIDSTGGHLEQLTKGPALAERAGPRPPEPPDARPAPARQLARHLPAPHVVARRAQDRLQLRPQSAH